MHCGQRCPRSHLKHRIIIRAFCRDVLRDVPLFDDLPVFVEPENIDPRDARGARHFLIAMQYHQIAFGNDALKMHVFVGVLFRQTGVIIDKGFFAVSDHGIMLDINVPDILPDGFDRARLIEHQIVKCHGVFFISFERSLYHIFSVASMLV